MIRKLIILAIGFIAVNFQLFSEDIRLSSKETLTVLEMNKGDKVEFTLMNGRTVNFELLDTDVKVLFTSLDTLKKGKAGEATIYSMTSTVRIDGQTMEMVRYIPVQETYYKPWVVNGLTIWFDAVKGVSEYFNENHGKCLPGKDARFAFQEAGKQICPQELSNWWPETRNQVFIKDGYMGEDSWLGPYFGADLHGGLDVNMPSNTPILAPIDFDEHYLFNSVKTGHNNNRWRGVRHWDNGDIWYLQTHHINELVIPQYRNIRQGEVYAHGAGTWCWYSPHSHFVFNTYQPALKRWMLMDPWVVIWQIFENNRTKANSIRANIEPHGPAQTGEKVRFSSKGSNPGIYGGEFEFFWDFGDGYSSLTENPGHVFQKAGIYPVTLTVRCGYSSDSYTQHITVNGEEMNETSFVITSDDDPSFNRRPSWKTSAYAAQPGIARTLVFNSYQDSEGDPAAKTVSVWFNKFAEGGNIDYPDDIYAKPEAVLPVYRQGHNWLEIKKIPAGDHVDLSIRPIMDSIIVKWGSYEAYIMISHNKALNEPQYIRVLLDMNYDRPKPGIIVDNSDDACTKSGYYWLAPTQHSSISKGYNKHYFISGGNRNGEYIRYTPNLQAGTYLVSLYGDAYGNPKIMKNAGSFDVIINHAGGRDKVRVTPTKSLTLGTYEFKDGRDGYVEIVSDDADGLIIADAVKFDKQ